jgi:hypothetical protein
MNVMGLMSRTAMPSGRRHFAMSASAGADRTKPARRDFVGHKPILCRVPRTAPGLPVRRSPSSVSSAAAATSSCRASSVAPWSSAAFVLLAFLMSWAPPPAQARRAAVAAASSAFGAIT